MTKFAAPRKKTNNSFSMKTIYKTIAIFLLAGTGVDSAQAQNGSSQTWTLRQCIDYAIEHNINIRQTANEAEQNKVDVNTAKWARLPNLSGSASQNWSWGRSASPVDNSYSDINSANTSLSLGTNVPIFTGLQLSNQYSLAKLNLRAAIEDLKGMKLRVSNDPVMNGMVEALGAYPTVVSFGELYSALQTGVVDGAEQPIANYKSNAFPEVANNLILDGHTLGAIQAVITDNAWGKLTENQQAAIMEAAKDTQAFNAELSETEENKVLEELKSSGCNVVDVTDKTPWADACAKVIEDNTKAYADLYQKIRDMK